MKLRTIAKAVVAALGAFASAFAASMPQGITVNEWVLVVVFTLIAGLAVYATPNRPA